MTGLTNGTGYLFRVAAVNGVGMGVYSATFGPVTPRTVPTSPTSVVALARNGAARVSWAAPVSNGGLAITGYTVTADIGGSTCTTSGALTCDVEGLTNGTTYTFTVRAINEAGTGSPSIASEAMSPGAVPGSPTSVVAVAGDRSATVSWAAPATNGGSAIVGYTVTASGGGQTCTTAGALACSVTGLTNGLAYTFTVSATNDAGVSLASGPSAPAVPRTVPSAPRSAVAVAGNARASISWAAPATNGGSTITGYTVTASDGGRTCTTGGALTCTVTGLTNGLAYTFTVSATNEAGTSTPSAASTPVTPRTVPDAPSSVVAVAGNGSATVSWRAPVSDGGATVSGYMVTASGGGRTCSTSSALTCEVTGLTNGTAYTFTATATNSVGRSASSEASAPVTPAMVPGSVSIVEGTAGDGQVDLAWTSPAEHGSEIADYVVEYSTDGLAWTAFDDGISIMRGGPVTGLTNGTGYLFRVAAVNGVGMGVYSATFG
ncbi:MAG: fibronectin type III domain-containing protein, partial [Candidatus Nanopelagicales bacterium]